MENGLLARFVACLPSTGRFAGVRFRLPEAIEFRPLRIGVELPGESPFEVTVSVSRLPDGNGMAVDRFEVGSTLRAGMGSGLSGLWLRQFERHLELTAGRPVMREVSRRLARSVVCDGPEPLVVHGDTLELRVTLACNQSCRFCNTGPGAENVVARPGEAERALETGVRLGARRAMLTGGEPLLLGSRLEELVRLAAATGYRQTIVQTSGAVPGSEQAIARLAAAGAGGFFFSLHTASAGVSDRITGLSGGFALTIGAIDRAVALAGVETMVNTVVQAENLSLLPGLAAFLHERYGDRFEWILSYVLPSWRALGQADLFPRPRAVRPLLLQTLVLAREMRLRVRLAGRCGLPLCLVPGFEAWHDDFGSPIESRPNPDRFNDPRQTGGQQPSRDKLHGPACAMCIHRDRCAGLHEYLIGLGFMDEIEPVLT